MSLPPHAEARLQFHRVLEELLLKGCQRWQTQVEQLTNTQVASGQVRWKLTKFVREAISDQAYRSWILSRQGKEEPDAPSLKSRRALEHFVGRLRRAENSHGQKLFSSDELSALCQEFERYWEIDTQWFHTLQLPNG